MLKSNEIIKNFKDANSKTKDAILIVNESPLNVLLLKRFLKLEGYIILSTNSIEDALYKTSQEEYSLILIGNLKNSSLSEISSNFRQNERTQNTPLILLVEEKLNKSILNHGLKNGIVDFINTSFLDVEELILKVNNHIKTYHISKELSRSKKILHNKEIAFENKIKDINDSVNYAKLIQKSLLPKINFLESFYNECFIVYKPKDTIGGDFFWMDVVNNRLITVCGDCIGHGVPGAMLSMIGYQLVSQIINENRTFSPGEILTQLHKKLGLFFENESEKISNCIDMSICSYRFDDGVLEFAGAKGYTIIQNGDDIFELKGDAVSIGDEFHLDYQFKTQYYLIDSDTWLYQFTDGYQDQFGGAFYKKFSKKKLIELLKVNNSKSAKEKKVIIEDTLSKWMNSNFQIDDITILGVKLAQVK